MKILQYYSSGAGNSGAFKKSFILLLFAVFIYTQPSSAQTVYKTPSGAKYHTATCRTVKNVSQAITLQQAVEMGLGPCKVCKPTVSYVSGSTNKRPQGQGQTVQCKGKTKAGTRCRHMTRIANGYCFQHQPG